MSGKQLEFSMVFRANVASGKAAIADLTNTLKEASSAGDKAGASSRKQASDLQDLAQATVKAAASQEELIAAEQRAQAVRAKAMVVPPAAHAVSFTPMQAAFKATETAAGSFRGTILGARVTTQGLAADLVGTAEASRAYQSALDDIRATFNPLFAASRQYEEQLDRISEAEKLGAISAREAASARLAAADVLSSPQSGVAAASRNNGYTANIGAQGFDIGMTAMMGMDPLMIGLQQGTQLAGIAQQMGGGVQAAKGLAAGLGSIFSVTTLVTVGFTMLAAVGIQAFASLASSGKTLEDRMGDLKTAFDRYKSSAQVSGQGTEDMVRQFGLGAGAAEGLYSALAKIDRLSLDQKLKAVSSAVRETIGLSANDPRFGNTNRISQFFDLGSTMFAAKNPNTGRAAALNKTIREFEAAEGIDAQTAAMQKLVEQTVELATLKGGISEEEQALIDVLKEQADVLLGIQAIETARAETLKRQIDQMVLGYSQEAELQAASLQFGSDAAAVEQIRARHARENLDVRLEEMGVEKGSVEWLKAKVGLSLQLAAQEATRAEAAKDRVRDQEDELAAINREIALIGVSNAERARANALAEADIEIRKRKLQGLDAVEERLRAVAKAEAEIALEQKKALADIATTRMMDGYDARIAATRNPFIKAEIEAEKEYARVLIETGDATRAAASAAQVREKAMGDATRAQDEFMRSQGESLQQLRLELSLAGETAEVRARVLALAEAERQIRDQGIDGASGRAAQLRADALERVDIEARLDRITSAWARVDDAAGSAIENMVDALTGGGSDSLRSAAQDALGLIKELTLTNPLKNAILGQNLPTMADVGGLGGIFGRLFGKEGAAPALTASTMSAASMAVTTPMVTLNAGSIAGLGAGVMPGLSGTASGAAGVLPGSGDIQSQIWSFFAGKGMQPHQIAAIMGHVGAESGFNPLAMGDQVNGVPKAFGLFQWNDRRNALFDSIGGQQNLGDVNKQLEFAWQELMTSENGPFKRLMASTNLYDATHAFSGFERMQGYDPNSPQSAHGWDRRLAGAEAAMAKFEGTTVTAQTQLGALGTGAQQLGSGMQQMSTGLAGVFQNIGASHGPGGAFLGGLLGEGIKWLGGALGFERGGYTGSGATTDVAGVVHAEEYVFDAATTRRIGVSNLDAMRRGVLRGYRDGGYVRAGRSAVPALMQSGSADTPARPSERMVMEINVSGTGNSEVYEATHAAISKALEAYDRDAAPMRIRAVMSDRWSD